MPAPCSGLVTMVPLVTIVTPVLGDTDAARALLAQIPATLEVDIIVVDGGADPEIEGIVAAHGRARLRRSAPGRAHQMNAGATGATGEWLFFLHADSTLPPGWLPAILALCDAAVGGWIPLRLG